MRLLAIVLFLSMASVSIAFATTPFPATPIWQDDQGKWICPGGWLTHELRIVDRNKKVYGVSLHDLFPGDEYNRNVSETTAGSLWGQNSLHYIVEIKGASYFTLRGYQGKRVLVRLDTGMIEKPELYEKLLVEADKKEMRAMLSAAAVVSKAAAANPARSQPDSGVPDDFNTSKLEVSINLALKYKMTDLRPQLEQIEGSWPAWYGGQEIARTAFGKGMNAELIPEYYEVNSQRRAATLALMHLGFAPRGYPSVIFEKAKANAFQAPDERLRKTRQLNRGLTAQEVYELLGPPDVVERINALQPRSDTEPKRKFAPGDDAWRYDWGPEPDLTLFIDWDRDGKVAQVIAVRPGLWHGDACSGESETRGTLSIGNCRIGYSAAKQFLPRAEDFLAARGKDSGERKTQ
jgi:hypothetical protein